MRFPIDRDRAALDRERQLLALERLRDANKQLRRDAERSSELEKLREQLRKTNEELGSVKGKLHLATSAHESMMELARQVRNSGAILCNSSAQRVAQFCAIL